MDSRELRQFFSRRAFPNLLQTASWTWRCLHPIGPWPAVRQGSRVGEIETELVGMDDTEKEQHIHGSRWTEHVIWKPTRFASEERPSLENIVHDHIGALRTGAGAAAQKDDHKMHT